MKMSDGVILRVASCARLDIHNQSRNAEERCFFPKRLTQVREMLLYTELKKTPQQANAEPSVYAHGRHGEQYVT